jgi:hypothetical protein
VTVPCAWKAGLSLARASAEVSARGPSSAEKTVSVTTGLPAFRAGNGGGDRHRNQLIGEASGGLRGEAFWWLARAKAS